MPVSPLGRHAGNEKPFGAERLSRGFDRRCRERAVRRRDRETLRERLFDVLEFYYPACADKDGHIAGIDEQTGEVYDPESRHLVATCRFINNFAVGAAYDGPDWCQQEAARGLSFLESAHRNGEGYAWLLDRRRVENDTRKPYGHVFVLLAHARAAGVGIDADVDRVARLLEERFGDSNGLFGPTKGPDWEPLESYRGQNPNMHACEALLVAYETTGRAEYLERATTVARQLTVELVDDEGRIWEHYTADWEPDYGYNRDNPHHQFRPWGYQPGHHAEWAKLLAGLARHRSDGWLLERAEELFAYALVGWDDENGGFHYTLDGTGDPVVREKYGWPVAEAIGAAAALYEHLEKNCLTEWYDRLWQYAENHLLAPRGNWYAKLTAGNGRLPTGSGPAVEPGYHPVGACHEALRAFD